MNDKNIRLAIMMFLVLFFGNAFLEVSTEGSSRSTVSAGGIAMIDRPPMMIFTCSEDGKTLYRWQCDPRAPSEEPKYLGKTEAVLSE